MVDIYIMCLFSLEMLVVLSFVSFPGLYILSIKLCQSAILIVTGRSRNSSVQARERIPEIAS